MSADLAPDTEEFVISRLFDASLDLVWKAHTEVERLRQWWGPKGFTMLSAELDLRPGGMFHYGMRAPDGSEIWGRFVYREITAPKRIVFLESFSDAQGGATRHPWSATWPLKTLNTLTLSEQESRTRVTITSEPHDATIAERRTFESGRECMRMGFTGTFDQLAAYLARAQS
jgi:uncharacterized protein YndB with AHSA1/START domain